MTESESSILIYTVVDVVFGMTERVKSFCRYEDARAYLRRRKKGRDLTIDDVQLFEDTIKLPARLRHRTLRAT